MLSKIKSHNNVFKKVLALCLCFSLSALPVEARKTRAKARPSITRKATNPKISKRVGRSARPKRVASRSKRLRKTSARPARGQGASKRQRVSAASRRTRAASRPVRAASKRSGPGKTAQLVAKQQEVLRQQVEAARVAAERQRVEIARVAAERQRVEAARIAEERVLENIRQQRRAAWDAKAPVRQQFRAAWNASKAAFLATPFENHVVITRHTIANIPVNYECCDLGYAGLPHPARTAQYGLCLPAATVLHPYHMDQNTKVYQTAAFLLNVRFPVYNPDFGPQALHRHLVDLNPANIEMFLIIQDMPWAGNLQLKPQYWLNPNAPYGDLMDHNEAFQVSVGVFPRQPNGPRIQGQPKDDLIKNHSVSIHNGRDRHGIFHPELISSGNTLSVPLNTDISQSFFSLTKYRDKAAVVLHGVLNRPDAEQASQELSTSVTLNDFRGKIQAVKAAGIRFQNLDIDALF